MLRLFLKKFITDNASKYGTMHKDCESTAKLLDIAPQVHPGANQFKLYSNNLITVDTLDIDPLSNSTFILDITNNNSDIIPSSSYDYIVCTEVLEHTLQPFHAVEELYRMLKPGGILFFSMPCNFRIHGPFPDNWRITYFGLKTLFPSNLWDMIECHALDYVPRPLFPLDYTCVFRKKE